MPLDGGHLLGDARMKKVTFKVKTRVVLLSESYLTKWDQYENYIVAGEVLSVDAEDNLTVKWDDDCYRKNTVHKSSELILEKEANIILSKLEEEFEVWANPIRIKIKEAAKSLEEANELAILNKKELVKLHSIVSPLIYALNNIGWETSSFSC